MRGVHIAGRAFVVGLLGLAALSGCTSPGGPGTPTPPSSTIPDPARVVRLEQVEAWANAMPGPPGAARKLHVSAVAVLPSPGYSAELVAAEPQGFNPRILLLRLKVVSRAGTFPAVIVRQPVTFEADAAYDRVTILDFGIDVPVQLAR